MVCGVAGGVRREEGMACLVTPTVAVHESFLAAMSEFRAEGRGRTDDVSMIGYDHQAYGSTWHTPDGFAAYVADVVAQSREDAPRPRGWVPATTLWLVEGAEYLGRIQLRHRLTEFLREVGGHIGYDVRPSARLNGHATLMLRGMLPVARVLGIDPALVTCDSGNVGSRKVIEKCGGELEDERNGKLRFWVPTMDSESPQAG